MKVLLLLLIPLFFFVLSWFLKKQKDSHAWRRKSADKAFKKIQKFTHPGQIFSYLRKVDPFVVEEIILNSIEHREDIEVIRNERYTGDNGVDGRFILTVNNNGICQERLFLIQVKRYSNHINSKDIEKFHNQINSEDAYSGLFVHTGKSGKGVYDKLSNSRKIKLLSGQKLIDLLLKGVF